jgi:hypothetical protein
MQCNATLIAYTLGICTGNAQSKNAQRVCKPSHEKETKELIDKEVRWLTRGIKHWGLSGYSSILPRIKIGLTGQESSPQSPTISYRRPLCARLRNTNTYERKDYNSLYFCFSNSM